MSCSNRAMGCLGQVGSNPDAKGAGGGDPKETSRPHGISSMHAASRHRGGAKRYVIQEQEEDMTSNVSKAWHVCTVGPLQREKEN